MCAGAIANARIRRLYYGAVMKNPEELNMEQKVLSHKQCHHKPEIYNGIWQANQKTAQKISLPQKET